MFNIFIFKYKIFIIMLFIFINESLKTYGYNINNVEINDLEL